LAGIAKSQFARLLFSFDIARRFAASAAGMVLTA
jgi:hypothetical protein